ncbi:uncharacterized protein LOC118198406 [Stegodyphus dumicola]|uniref:uncharacterized protein LOC118198406 n=1 Tax=Stegodyphus dumicola TaxID=202533 RepID=UPI0015A8777E|nr:uncharacterized protein LOC118198406 [Stegodyphus dumicola]
MEPNVGEMPVLFLTKFDPMRCDASTMTDFKSVRIGIKRKREETQPCSSLKVAKSSSPVSSESKNVLRLLSSREKGAASSSNFISDLSTMKARELSLTNFFFTSNSSTHITDCEFIRGSRDGKSIIGLWKGDHYDAIIYRLTFEFSSKYENSDKIPPIVKSVGKVGPFFALTRVRDMCDARFRQQNCVLYVGNRFNERSVMEGSTVLCNFTNDSYTYGRQYISKRDILSCAGNAHGELFATGTEQGCYIFDDDRFTYKARLPGNVRSIEFNDSGKMLFCGVDTAGLTVFDLREPPCNRRTVRVNRFGPVGVSETKLLSGEKTMIVSGIDGSLSKSYVQNVRRVMNGEKGNVQKIFRKGSYL